MKEPFGPAGSLRPSGPGPRLIPGALVASRRYRILRKLGEGATREVYQAHDTHLGCDVAFALIKVGNLDAEGRARVADGIRAMARLRGKPYLVDIYDTGEEDGQPYIVSQFMPGRSIGNRLNEVPGRRLEVPEAIRIADEICQALDSAHSIGIVHRDLKPSNVWLTQSDTVMVGDFGFAIKTDPLFVKKTAALSPSVLHGTVLYMSPERLLGEPQDARSDLYSLGAMVYEMVTGRPPFVGKNPVDVAASHIKEKPDPPSRYANVWSGLEDLILKLLKKSPLERPQSAAEVRDMLRHVRRDSVGRRATRRLRRHLKPVLAILATTIGTIVLGVLSTWLYTIAFGPPGPRVQIAARPTPDTVSGSGIQIAASGGPPGSVAASPATISSAGPATSPIAPPFAVASPVAAPPITGEGAPPSGVCSVVAPRLNTGTISGPPEPTEPCGSDVGGCAKEIDECRAKAELKSLANMAQLGYMYMNGLGVERNYTLAKNWSQWASTGGNPLGQDTMGKLYNLGEGGVPKDHQQAQELFVKAAAQDCALAENDLGDLNLYGEGVGRNASEAFKWYKKAADHDDAMGQNNLGYMYLHGFGINKNLSAAKDWYLKSAKQGNPIAQDALGYMYQAGLGVAKEPAQAFQCYKTAAEQGFATAQMHLAELYKRGIGVDQNSTEAAKWYCKAAGLGNLAANVQLHSMGANCSSLPVTVAEPSPAAPNVSPSASGEASTPAANAESH